jgi:hypothetical protein
MTTPAYPGGYPGPYDPARLPYPPEHLPPEYQAANQRERRRGRGWVLGCGIALGVLLVPCVLIGGLVGWLALQVTGTYSVLNTFCGDLKSRNYDAAYTTFSSGLRNQLSREQFVQVARDRDASDGPVRACGNPNNSVSLVNNTATLPIAITRNQTVQGTLALVKEGGNWKIDQLDPALMLTG